MEATDVGLSLGAFVVVGRKLVGKTLGPVGIVEGAELGSAIAPPITQAPLQLSP